MLIPILLVLAIGTAIAGFAARRRAVDDPSRSDREVLAVDVIVTLACTVLLGIGAIMAAATPPHGQFVVVATQVCAVLAAAFTGSSAVRVVLAAGGIPTRADNHDDEADAPLRGGRVIGLLERTAVAASLLLAWPAGVGVILAVKSLARFSELRAPRASEQFILGTFASVLWAAAFAGVGWLAAI